jgi:hypothetical protein
MDETHHLSWSGPDAAAVSRLHGLLDGAVTLPLVRAGRG